MFFVFKEYFLLTWTRLRSVTAFLLQKNEFSRAEDIIQIGKHFLNSLHPPVVLDKSWDTSAARVVEPAVPSRGRQTPSSDRNAEDETHIATLTEPKLYKTNNRKEVRLKAESKPR